MDNIIDFRTARTLGHGLAEDFWLDPNAPESFSTQLTGQEDINMAVTPSGLVYAFIFPAQRSRDEIVCYAYGVTEMDAIERLARRMANPDVMSRYPAWTNNAGGEIARYLQSSAFGQLPRATANRDVGVLGWLQDEFGHYPLTQLLRRATRKEIGASAEKRHEENPWALDCERYRHWRAPLDAFAKWAKEQ